MVALTEHFRRDDRRRHSDWLRQSKWFIKAKEEQARREEIADRLENGMISLATDVAIATELQIREFQARLDVYEARLDAFDEKLDAYDAAVTEALIRNGERLALLEQQIADTDALLLHMLSNAYVMDDGRRVFKSEDGSFVIDEHGGQVGPDEVEFNLVVGATSAETYLEAREQERALTEQYESALEEREQLHDAQSEIDAARDRSADARTRLDETRERVSDGELSVQDLEDLDAELDAAMPADLPTLPIAAAKHLSLSAVASPLKPDFAAPVNQTADRDSAIKRLPSTAPEVELR